MHHDKWDVAKGNVQKFWILSVLVVLFGQFVSDMARAQTISEPKKIALTAPSTLSKSQDLKVTAPQVENNHVQSVAAEMIWEGNSLVIRETKKKVRKRKARRKKITKTTKTKKRTQSKPVSKRKKSKSTRKSRKLSAKKKYSRKRRKRRAVKKSCTHPLIYSRRLKRCACVRSGYKNFDGKCVAVAGSCPKDSIWSDANARCVCRPGKGMQGGECVPEAEIEDHEDMEGPVQLTGQNCPAPERFIALGAVSPPANLLGVGECPVGFVVEKGKCVRDQTVAQAPTQPQEPRQQVLANPILSGQMTTVISQKVHSPELKSENAPKITGATIGAVNLMEPIYDLGKIRQCLQQTGYFNSASERKYRSGAVFQGIFDAFERFRAQNGLQNRPSDLYDLVSQTKLFAQCNPALIQAQSIKQPTELKPSERVVVSTPDRMVQAIDSNKSAKITPYPEIDVVVSTQSPADMDVTSSTQPLKVQNYASRTCLPEDLFEYVTASQGNNDKLKKCRPGCLPTPEGMPTSKQKELQEQYGIRWCVNCLAVGTYMPLKDIRRVETKAKVEVCATPPTSLAFPEKTVQIVKGEYAEFLSHTKGLSTTQKSDDTLFVLIGNKNYSASTVSFPNAFNDVSAFRSVLTRRLNVEADKIIDLRDARQEQLELLFGRDGSRGLIADQMRQLELSRLVVYYSGASVGLPSKRQNYLLPVDYKSGDEETTGYSMRQLYRQIRQLKARDVLLVLETRFAKEVSSNIEIPNLPGSVTELQPLVPVPGLTILSGSDGAQQVLADPELGVGIFTKHFLAGLSGEADRQPLGNGDGTVNMVELYTYTSDRVRLHARKSFGLMQKPKVYQMRNYDVSQFFTDQ